MDFVLKPWSLDDLPSLVRYANNPRIARFMKDVFPHPYTEQAGIEFINRFSHDDPIRVFAIHVNGEAAGSIGIHPQGDIMRLNAELGYWLAEPYWGNGIITSAVREIIPYAFTNFDIRRIFARVFSPNIASQHVLEKCGFRLEANIQASVIKNGEILDEFIFAVRQPSDH